MRFSYHDGRPALEGVDIAIRPGEHVAICGPNGAGKSTLVTLIPRLREPTGGVIELDGVPLADLDLGVLRQEVAVVFQNPLLVDGTIEDNVLMAAGDSDEETIRWAMETAGVTEFAASLEGGVLTTVGESGEALSGGQRQRIALARALARRPAVLILDEPTSAIDDVAARRLRERIPEAMRGTTVLCVTHDAAWVEAMDRVIVMDRGTIVSDQSREDWMADDRGSTIVGDTMLRESR